MNKMIEKEKIVPRSQDFAKWYTSIIHNANLIVYGSIKGTMIFQPNAWSIWENIQSYINIEFKKNNISNVFLPLLIPMSELNKEKNHIAGFAPEVYTVTKIGNKELNEPYVIRPTSEVSFCEYFKYITSSYKNLPIKLNQWCSVLRAEKSTKPFLRNSEFFWQELHSIFSNDKECINFTYKIINLYAEFVEKILCIPVIKGEKTIGERFAGADKTLTIEALMQDGQMLQCGTSHYLGQNFAKAYDIKFQNQNNNFDFVYQMSAGISTRIIGALIMVHGDDHGLILPPLIAPTQIVINTIGIDFNDIQNKTLIKNLTKILKKYRYKIDDSNKSLGQKLSSYEVEGIPIQIVVGKKTINDETITIYRRDLMTKEDINLSNLENYIKNLINTIQKNIYEKAKKHLTSSIVNITTIAELKNAINKKKIAIAYWAGSESDEKKLKELTGGITPRCIYQVSKTNNKCFFTKKDTKQIVLFARAY